MSKRIVLNGFSLDEILENVRVGNSGFDEEERERIVEKMENLALGYYEATTELSESSAEISRKRKLNHHSITSWRRGRIPDQLRKYCREMEDPLNGLTLDELVRNIKENNSWRPESDEEEIIETVSVLSNLYKAFHEALFKMDKLPTVIGKKFGFTESCVKQWRNRKKLARKLFPYSRCLVPSSEEEKKEFVYFLGAYSRRYGTKKRSDRVLRRHIRDSERREHFKLKAERYTGLNSPIRGEEVTIQNKNFVEILKREYERLDQVVANDALRKEFLKGFFDASKISPSFDEKGLHYKISSDDEELKSFLLKCLFELGVYSKVNSYHLRISGEDLGVFHELGIDQNKKNRDFIDGRVKPVRHGIVGTYYAVMKSLQSENPESSWELKSEFGLNSHTNIIEWKKGHIPNRVKRYKAICDKFDYPNVYTNKGIVRRNEKVFFTDEEETYLLFKDVNRDWKPVLKKRQGFIPVNGKVMYIDEHSLFMYRRQFGGDLRGIQAELELVENGKLKSKLSGVKVEDSEIKKINRKYPFQDFLELNINGESYLVLNRALSSYFSKFNLEASPLSEDNVSQIKRELKFQIDKDEDSPRLMKFDIEGNYVVNIELGTNKLDVGKYIRMRAGVITDVAGSNILGYELEGHDS